MGTDRDWENWGRNDPYFGVLSDESFRAENLSNQNQQAFFQTGEKHIESVLTTIRRHFSPKFAPQSALDFGCGVGRLLIPLARRCGHAAGVDISTSMLAEAKRNCDAQDLHNVEFLQSDDGLSKVHKLYDLIHSHIVFAHINPRRGHSIIEALADKVSPQGFIAIQVLYACDAPRWVRSLVRLRYRLPPLNALRNLMRGRPLREPAMQLHVYDLPLIVKTLNRLGFDKVLQVSDQFDRGQFHSTVLIAQRTVTSIA